MSKLNVLNWLKMIEYVCPALHQALADEQLGLQHALLFIQYPIGVTERAFPPVFRVSGRGPR
jgi:hypothetical protein